MDQNASSSWQIPRALTIAGSDSGGCAGIQADLRTFAALGVHGLTAITCVTVQDTQKVYQTEEIAPDIVSAQIRVVLDDIGADAVKTGMLSSPELIREVAGTMRGYEIDKLVVDPVMISTGGDRLIRETAVGAIRTHLLPITHTLTPNLQEAESLLERTISSHSDMLQAARDLHRMGPRYVFLKGGHMPDSDQAKDVVFDGKEIRLLTSERIKTRNTHGSGCTLAAAIAASLARGLPAWQAFELAKLFVTNAIEHSYALGKGNGPLGHLAASRSQGTKNKLDQE
jgi:hydroxymethylpyrimidine/phosphomethylpyrimidine kinase